MKHLSLLAFFLFVLALAAAAHDPIPVYGPARAAMDDDDLLSETILEPCVIAVSPQEPEILYIGDGLTPGGRPVHARGCITNFAGVSVATTNLDMRSWSIKWGPWNAHGDANEWDIGYGSSEVWLSFVRDTGLAYLAYEFTIVDNETWLFELTWSDDATMPVLEVSTNLLEGFVAADESQVSYTRVDATHVIAEFTPADGDGFYAFRFFAAERMATGIYAREPLVAEKGVSVGGVNCTNWNDLPFIPKWPMWYMFGDALDGTLPPSAYDSAGLFRLLGTIFLQNTNGDIHIVAKGSNPMSLVPGSEVWVNSVSGGVRIAAGMQAGDLTPMSGGLSLAARSGIGIISPSLRWNNQSITSWADLAQWLVPKWPSWYQFGTNGDTATDFRTAEGLFRASGISFLNVSNDAPLVIRNAGGPTPNNLAYLDLESANAHVQIQGAKGVKVYAHDSGNGAVLTNSADNVFPVTWNGETKTGWDDITEGCATTSAVASVERRLDREDAETCTLFWPRSFLRGTNLVYPVPTNFPTRNLRVLVYETEAVTPTFDCPPAWDPGREVTIEVVFGYNTNRTSSNATAVRCCGGTWQSFNGSSPRLYTAKYHPESGSWETFVIQPPSGTANYQFTTDGTRSTSGVYWNTNAPTTVEEWLAIHPEWATP